MKIGKNNISQEPEQIQSSNMKQETENIKNSNMEQESENIQSNVMSQEEVEKYKPDTSYVITEPELNYNETKTDLKLGTYKVSKYAIEYNSEQPEEFSGEESITFGSGNKFEAYMGWGITILGDYNISNNRINCNIKTFKSEFNSEDNIIGNATIIFELKENNTIEVVQASEGYVAPIYNFSYDIGFYKYGEKEYTMYPFEASATFTLTY